MWSYGRTRADDAPEGPPSLGDSLAALTVSKLKWYAAGLGGRMPTRKDDLIALLVDGVSDPEALRQRVAALSPRQREALGEVVHRHNGEYDRDAMTAKYPDVPPPHGPEDYYVYGGRDDRQRQAGPFDLFFFHHGPKSSYVPPELAPRLRTLLPLPQESVLTSQDAPPDIPKRGKRETPEVFVSDTERAAFHDLTATLDLVGQGKIAVGASTRLPTLGALRALRGRLLIADYLPQEDYARAEDAVRPLALVVLVQAAGWAAPAGKTGGKLALTEAGKAALAATVGPDHVRTAWQGWLRNDLLDELSRIRNIKGQQANDVHLTKPAARRETLAGALESCPPGRWVRFDEFLRFLRAERLLPVVERANSYGLRVGGYSSYYDYEPGYDINRYWDVIQGSYVRAAVWEYVATLGVVEIAYTWPEDSPHDFGDFDWLDDDYLSRYDGLLGLKLTNLGAYVLGLAEGYRPPAAAVDGPPPLRVLPNLDVVVTDTRRLLPIDRAFLTRIAAPQSEDVYRLSRDLVLDSVQQGLSPAQARAFLAAQSGTPETDLPQTVRVFFTDLESRLDALRDRGRMILLESDDPLLLTELSNQAGLRTQVQLGQVGDRAVLLVPETHETAVRRQLKKLGYIPRQGE